MSTEISSDVWKYSKQKGSHLLLLAALADYANEEGWCWPSVKSLCRRTRLSERYVQQMLVKIVADGELQVKERVGSSNYYRVTIQVPNGGVRPNAPLLPDAPRGEAGRGGGVLPDAPRTISGTVKEPSIAFEAFWKTYPKREAKADALKAWKKVREKDVPKLMQALEAHKRLEGWTKDHGQYIPLAATWLNGKRWEDEISPSKPTSTKPAALEIPFWGHDLNLLVQQWEAHLAGDPGGCTRSPEYLRRMLSKAATMASVVDVRAFLEARAGKELAAVIVAVSEQEETK